VGASQGDYWKTGFDDHLEDAAVGLAWLRSRDNVDTEQVFVLGHSEGASIAIRLASREASMAGVILLAGSRHSGEETLIWKAQRIAQGMGSFNEWLIDRLHIDIRKSQ
jgi:dienelactone hydrolase